MKHDEMPQARQRKSVYLTVETVRQIVDEIFPEVGRNCPNFPVMVVLLSAAMTQNTSPAYLKEFTHYSREYIDAVAANMTNNALWKADRYVASGWLGEQGMDEEEFGRQVDAAMGVLWYPNTASPSKTVDVLRIKPETRDRSEWVM